MAAIEAVEAHCLAGQDPILVDQGRPDLQPGLAGRLRKQFKHAECRIVRGLAPSQQTLSLIDACDMYLSLHRIFEGLQPDPREAMALGKPVVATGCWETWILHETK